VNYVVVSVKIPMKRIIMSLIMYKKIKLNKNKYITIVYQNKWWIYKKKYFIQCSFIKSERTAYCFVQINHFRPQLITSHGDVA